MRVALPVLSHSLCSDIRSIHAEVFAAFSLVLTGVACWDVLSTLWFEWQIITGKRKWKWPMVSDKNLRHIKTVLNNWQLFGQLIYIIARIAMLLHIFAITINRNALSEVPCTELTFMSKCKPINSMCHIVNSYVNTRHLVCDAVGTCASSLILGLRTRAVWHRDTKVSIIMGVFFVGQMVMWAQSEYYTSCTPLV